MQVLAEQYEKDVEQLIFEDKNCLGICNGKSVTVPLAPLYFCVPREVQPLFFLDVSAG